MLRKRAGEFAEAVWIAASRVGAAAPRIAEELLVTLFPVTARAAEDEGAAGIFRKGLTSEIGRVLKSRDTDISQIDMSEIEAAFAPMVRALGSSSYLVKEGEERIGISRLIAEPHLLNAARKYMRSKGEECLAEARKLDELYAAVMARAAA